MDRCGIFIDAGYLFAAGGQLCGYGPARGDVELDSLIASEFFAKLASESCGLPLLRTYWYDGAKDGIPTADHQRIAALPNLKLRLGRINARNQQKGVDALIYRDLTTLARERAISDAFLLTGDEDLRQRREGGSGHGASCHAHRHRAIHRRREPVERTAVRGGQDHPTGQDSAERVPFRPTNTARPCWQFRRPDFLSCRCCGRLRRAMDQSSRAGGDRRTGSRPPCHPQTSRRELARPRRKQDQQEPSRAGARAARSSRSVLGSDHGGIHRLTHRRRVWVSSEPPRRPRTHSPLKSEAPPDAENCYSGPRGFARSVVDGLFAQRCNSMSPRMTRASKSLLDLVNHLCPSQDDFRNLLPNHFFRQVVGRPRDECKPQLFCGILTNL